MDCNSSSILGVFPDVGMSCSDTAFFLGFLGLLASFIFWNEVIK